MTDARVARLRLTAADEAHVRRGAILVEDAMRIATLAPDADRRMYIVRHLDVGVIDPDAPSHTLALQIERRLAHVQRTAVPATSPAAATARAVWFADEATATAELARRLAVDTPSEWFWKHVAGGAVTATSPARALEACVVAAARSPAGPLAIAAVVDAAESAREGAILGLLDEHDGESLCRATFGAVPLSGLPAADPDVVARLLPRWRERVARWIVRWGADARSLWLAAIAVIASRGSLASVETELGRARQVVATILTRAASEAIESAESVVRPVRRAEGEPERALRERESSEPDRADTTPVLDESTVTSMGAGALFLIRPLAMLGIVEWLEQHAWTARVCWPAQLLAAIVADHAGPEDPLVAALATQPLLDGPFVAPERWRAFVGRRPHRLRPVAGDGRLLEAFGRLPLAAWTDAPPPLEPWRAHRVCRGSAALALPWAAIAWQRALARWLRTFTSLRLADLVCRRATITSTPTHLDLAMPLDSADVRIRAAGLDVDPGWVPWLGRIVRFHYREERR